MLLRVGMQITSGECYLSYIFHTAIIATMTMQKY
jgi:hypothetical protein